MVRDAEIYIRVPVAGKHVKMYLSGFGTYRASPDEPKTRWYYNFRTL